MTDTPKPKIVFATILPPTASNPTGMVAEGAYILADGVVTLTDRNGKPVKDADGKVYKVPVGDNNPDVLACILTRKFRNALRGKKGSVAGFNRPLGYFNPGKI